MTTFYRSRTARNRRNILCPLLAIALYLLVPHSALPSPSDTLRIDDITDLELFPVSSTRAFGIDRQRFTTRLALVDSTAHVLSATIWSDLDPVDFVSTDSTGGYLLARTGRYTLLYEIDFASGPTVRPIWQKEGYGYSAIRSGHGEVLFLSGDSGLIRIDLSVPEPPGVRISNEPVLLHPVGQSKTTHVVVRSQVAVVLVSIDEAGSILRTLLVSTDNDGVAAASLDDRTLDLLIGGPRFDHLRIRSDGGISSIGSRRIGNVFGIIPIRRDQSTRFFVASAEGLEVLLSDVAEAESRFTLSSPFSAPIDSVAGFGDSILILTRDSVALVRRNSGITHLGARPAGTNLRLIPFRSHLLVTASGGTFLLDEVPPPAPWWERDALLIAASFGGLVLLVGIILFFSRFRRMRAIYRTFVESDSSSGYLVLTSRGRLFRANARAFELLGWPDGTPGNRHVLEYLSTGHLQVFRDGISEHLRNGTPVSRQDTLQVDDAKRIVRMSIRRISGRYGSNRGSLVEFVDLTDAVERERLLNWASVAHHIAHEMKTPLGTIRTTVDAMRDSPGSEGQTEEIARILRSTTRLREIVEDLLTVARSEEMRTQSIDLGMLIGTIVEEFEDYMPKTCRCDTSGVTRGVRAMVDPDLLAVAIRNVIDNAREAIGSREGGVISIELDERESTFVLHIGDNGIGMSEEVRSNFFEPFFTKKKQGSGLGTVIIRRVVEAHGGGVRVESRLGEGTSVSIEIPTGDEETPAPQMERG